MLNVKIGQDVFLALCKKGYKYMATFISDNNYKDLKYTTSTNVGSSINTTSTYSINIGGTTLETTDIDFIHALQKCGGSNQDIVTGLQNLMQTCKAN